MPFDKILSNGIIVFQNNYIKLIKVLPINYDLKSNLEKESILNSYKLFLKTCDFDIQILIQSKKENLSKQISHIENLKEKNNTLEELSNSYINFIKQKSSESKSALKDFFIAIKYSVQDAKIKENDTNNFSETIIKNALNEYFFKIKETLSRCGNIVYDINSKIEVEKVIESFINPN